MAIAAVAAGVSSVAGAVGGLLGGGGGQDPVKEAARRAAVLNAAAMAASGDKAALATLEGMANGTEWPGAWANHRALAQSELARVRALLVQSPPSPGLAGVFGGNGKQPAWVMPFLLLSAGFAVYWYGIRKAA